MNPFKLFIDPGFWVIGLEYVLSVAAYWRMRKAVIPKGWDN